MPYIRFLKDKGYEVDVACRDNTKEKPGNDFNGVDKFYEVDFSRSPYSFKIFKAYKQLKCIIESNDYDIIHCNTPVAGILTRLAAKKKRKAGLKVVYTAHGFHFYKAAPLKNWILYYPVEKYFSKHCDVLITINNEDYKFAKSKFKHANVNYVPGVGIDINKYSSLDVDVEDKRKSLGINKDKFVLMSVGELNKNKNYKIVLDALSQIDCTNIFYIICGVGPQKTELIDYAKSKNLSDKLLFLGYRKDIGELFKMSNLCLQPSFREGLPLTVMEAIACKVDILASDIRGCRDLLVKDDLFNPKDAHQLTLAIKNKIQNPNLNIDKNLENLSKFDVANVNKQLFDIYLAL